MKRLLVTIICLIGLTLAPNAFAGGALEQIDITGHAPSPIAGHYIAKVTGIRWDSRALPARYSMNTTLNPIPNPLGPPFLTVAQAQTAIGQMMATWTGIPTSYAGLQISGTRNNLGLRRFDFVNEITFRTANNFGAIASSPSVSLIEDTTLANGDDVDLDGDSDVSSAISVVSDQDGDGDMEFPAGFYKAGTILDNDLQFNTKTSNGFRFTVDDADVDNVGRSTDLAAIALHELGHSLGLSHSMVNQHSETDGNGATMFPFIDTSDRDSELSLRTLETDDVAFLSMFYPEGTATSGLAAIQAGDVRFSTRYGLIKGELKHGDLSAQPVAGGNVFAVDEDAGRLASGAYSGTTRMSFDPATGGLFLTDPAFNISDGRYTIPVPRGSYKLAVEPVDGQPVPSGSVSLTAQIGDIFGQQAFNEQSAPGVGELSVQPGQTRSGVNVLTSRTLNIDDFGTRNFVGFTNTSPGFYYAVAIPASRITAATGGGSLSIKGMRLDTFVTDASVVPVFSEVLLTTGTFAVDPGPPVTGSATIAVNRPLARAYGILGRNNFVGQDDDFATFEFLAPRLLGAAVKYGIDHGQITNLFIVLRNPITLPFPGVSAQPPFIGLDGVLTGANDVPIFLRSFTSSDGGATFRLDPRFNFRFGLALG